MRSLTIALILLLSLLSACTEEKAIGEDADAVIDKADLTEFEQHLMEITDMTSFSFDIDIKNEDVNKLHLTIDYYENGEFKQKIIDSSSALSEEDFNHTVRTVFIRQKSSRNQEKWVSSVMTETGYSSSESKLDITDREVIKSSAWGGISNQTPLQIGDKTVVASIVHSNKTGVSIYNSIKTEEDIEEATDYEQVYLISVELKK